MWQSKKHEAMFLIVMIIILCIKLKNELKSVEISRSLKALKICQKD